MMDFLSKLLGGSEEEPPSEVKLTKGPNVQLADSSNFDETVASDVTFVQFSLPRCPACVYMADDWDSLAAKFKGRSDVKIVTVDCSEDRQLCRSQGVRRYPTLFLYKNGRQVARYGGRRKYRELYAFLVQNL